MKFYKTIRFKITLWYSLILIVFCFAYVLLINLLVTDYLQRDPPPPFENGYSIHIERIIINPSWETLSDDRKELIRQYRLRDLDQFRQLSLLSFIPLILLSFAGGYIIAGRMLRPLKKLNNATKDINAKNLNTQILHDNTGDEISELIENFNSMILRLNESFDSQKQFVENASHELKTPLSIIKTNLEFAKMDGKLSKNELNEMFGKVIESTNFMNYMIEDLLLLSLLENQVNFEKVDIIGLIRECIKDLDIITNQKNIKINLDFKFDGSEKIFVLGNKVLLHRAISNIIENATKYSFIGKSVDILVSKSNTEIEISVQDQGIGISKEDLPKIFDRFYRADKSRSKKTGGSGLGLSIAKKIIELHKGTIKVESEQSIGTTFILTIPLVINESSRS